MVDTASLFNRRVTHPERTTAMDAAAFADTWRKSSRTERSAAQEHFLDLCEGFHPPKPGDVDPKGLTFTTERKVKLAGDDRRPRGRQADRDRNRGTFCLLRCARGQRSPTGRRGKNRGGRPT